MARQIQNFGGQTQDAKWSDKDEAVDQGHDDDDDEDFYESDSTTLGLIPRRAGDTTELDLIGMCNDFPMIYE